MLQPVNVGLRFCAVSALSLALLTGLATQTSLKEAYKDSFKIGAALNRAQFTETDARSAVIVKAQFNSISPENVLKWEPVHPRPDTYNFEPADRYVEFGEKNGMFIVGHTLVWHSQTPAWVFQNDQGGPADAATLLARMRDHIRTVVGRYRGRIHGWDVVNEAIADDGSMRQSPWLKILGEDFIVKAFEFAHEADPDAQLYYNDYGLENEAKRKGALALIQRLKSRGVAIHAVGLQDHHSLEHPTAEVEDQMISDFAKLKVHVAITELDVDVLPQATRQQTADIAARAQSAEGLNPYKDGLPDSIQQALAKRYADLFAVYRKHRGVVERVTFWGVTDANSWKNNFPVRGRTNYPLLFDRQGNPKPAFDAVIRVGDPHAR